MPTVDELLDSMASNPEAYSEADYITVNPSDRTLTVPASQQLFGVYQDKNVERKHFRCPKVVGSGIDISTCFILINYVSTGGNPGQYLCEDVAVDGDYITFSWELSANVFDGNKDISISFAVQAKKATEDGRAINVFNTRPATGVSYSTIEATEVINEEYADIILQLMARIDNVGNNQGALDEIAASLRAADADILEKLTELENTDANIHEVLTSLESADAGMNERLTDLETANADITERLNSLGSQDSSVNEKLTELENFDEAMSADLDAAEERIGQLETGVSQINTSVDELNAMLDSFMIGGVKRVDVDCGNVAHNLTIENDTIYDIVNCSTLTITLPNEDKYSAHLFIRFVSTGEVGLFFPDGSSVYGSNPQTVENSDAWEVDIDGVGGILCLRKQAW